jgi:hypothetical protein
MWKGLLNSLSLSRLPRLPMRKSRLRRRLLVLLPSTWNDAHSQLFYSNAVRFDSGMMEQTPLAQSEPRSLTVTRKRLAWRLCVKSASYALAALTVLSAFDTTPSFSASVNISCVQDYTTGECTDVGDSANRAVNVNVVAGGGGGGGTSSAFGAAFPANGTAAGFSDGTNMQPGRTVDADTGAGTVTVQGVNLLKRASGGPVEAGTASDPLRVDPTGTTPQPVTGTFFQATQPVSGPLTDVELRATPVPVSGPLTDAQLRAVPVPVSGTVTVNVGLTDAQLRATPVPVSGTVAATQSGTWTVQPGNTPNTSPWLTESIKVASANNTGSCPSGAANTTALVSNASRRGAYMAASSANTDDIYVKLGATATSSNFRLAPGQSFNILTGSIYTGIIDFFPASGTQALCVAELN